MNTLEAVECIDAYDNEIDMIEAYQTLINSGEVWHLQGRYGREAMTLIRLRLCELGELSCRDSYGSFVPSRYQVQAGTAGSPLHTRGTNGI